jgi:hypothetical protein
VLANWGKGTTAETFAPLPPDCHVSALALVEGDLARWEVRPDGTEFNRREEGRLILSGIRHTHRRTSR